MKKFIKKAKLLLQDTQGVSELITSIVGMFTIICMLVISISFITITNMQSVLNEFANQLIITMCDVGTTSGDEVDYRYEQLENTLNISPTITTTATYFADDNVQYGDTIQLSATLDTTISIFGFEYDFEFEIDKTGISEQYWK